MVKAERDNYDAGGIAQVIRPDWQVGFDAFCTEAENLIDEGPFGAPELACISQHSMDGVGRHRLRGVPARKPLGPLLGRRSAVRIKA